MDKTLATEAIVIKRTSVGEADRVITLLTPTEGKVVCIAKGVRKLASSQRAYLEPGNHVSVLLVHTRSLPILTQSKLLNDFTYTKHGLSRMKQLMEILEIIDVLFSEGAEEVELFGKVLHMLKLLDSPKGAFQQIQEELIQVLVDLGYQDMKDTQYTSVLDYVTAVADRPLKSYDYLTIREV
jgi:DNA repair protein RecO (recombination protein O)